jgi:sigma-54 dependent transcriptional regulator, acetoin dehydrogenase operon transcriptional activator AcoR
MQRARTRAGTDSDGLAETRVRFLSAEPVEPAKVREAILASWWRSRRSNVAADHIDMPYIRDPNLDTPLTRTAEPVLRHLQEQLAGQAISIVLTDHTGLVLSRLSGDADFERHLDTVQLAPGFSYAEEFVGTNGIGTALEGGRPMHVFGHEHYAENLEDLACAGVPIQHPISGKTVGAVDLTCWRVDAGQLLMTLAKSTAGQIRQALLADAGAQEIQLLQEYLRACHRTPGIVFALNNDVTMMNDYARTVLTPADQAALLRQAAEALATLRNSVMIELPSGINVQMHTKPVGVRQLAGGVVHAKVVESAASKAHTRGAPAATMLPGLVGSGALWRRACDEVDNAYRTGEWLALEGEPGVGKLAILRAVHQHRDPGGRFTVLDCAEATDHTWLAAARQELLGETVGDNPGIVVIRHLDQLDAARLRSLSAILVEAGEFDRRQTARVAVTFGPGSKREEFADILRLFPTTVEVPPLRHHIEDLQQLVPFFLARLGYGGQLTCSPEALRQMMRSSWPGNVEHVVQTLRRVVQHRRTGFIDSRDLPPETRRVSRRLLSPLESMECDAIAQALMDAHGNKARAARSLGMSRATIYRKIREFGIVTPAG